MRQGLNQVLHMDHEVINMPSTSEMHSILSQTIFIQKIEELQRG